MTMAYKTNYDILEDAIVAKLQPLTNTGVEVIRTPDTDAEKTTAFEKPRITVLYSGSEFSDQIIRGIPASRSTAEVVQTEYADIILTFHARKLRGANGLHALRVKVVKLLLGFKAATVWGRMFIKKYEFFSHDDGVWVYALTMVSSTPVIQDVADLASNLVNSDNLGLQENNDGTPLQELTFNSILKP